MPEPIEGPWVAAPIINGLSATVAGSRCADFEWTNSFCHRTAWLFPSKATPCQRFRRIGCCTWRC